ncbi:MAG: FAD/NAD(P)-binding protein [Bacteroidota bacterium]
MLETDYLIVGSGAVGMAFADIILTESEANIIIVDKHHKPGGHWNVAYPFVTLHQPSAFYGVSSKELSKGLKDQVGWNKGLADLASGAEVSAYFDDVMRHQFLPTGRVQYFPMCEYKGNLKFQSMLTGADYEVKVNKKLVDCTYLNTNVPSTHIPNFSVDSEVKFIALNDLTKIATPPAGFVIVGGGKTGIDACLWLLENNVNPDKIKWIVSRDAWLLDRQNTQPLLEFFDSSIGTMAKQMEAVAKAKSVSDLFEKLEDAGVLLRIYKDVTPSMFHGATISQMEVEQLRKIKNVVRLGRVQHIGADEIQLDRGTIPTSLDHVHVDCSASAITNLDIKPIFEEDVITPQTVRSYQPVFSAAVIAHVELAYEGNKKKNEMCQVVPLPNHDTDWIRMMSVFMLNQYNWSQDKAMRKWLLNNRLDGFGKMVKSIPKEDEEKMAVLKKMRNYSMQAAFNLQQLMAELDGEK